ncbi:MAG: rhodanese-like domain-containing protein [Betaproteobacteria bacterium]
MTTDATATQILDAAGARGRQKKLPYAGEVTPAEAHKLFSEFGAKIIDVRSAIEHEYIGRIPGSALVSWKQFPSGEMNAASLPQLQERASPDDVVLFLCRSGVRSHSAATVAAKAGYKHAYNILEGFEGDLNQQQRRGDTGWRKAGLPWIQS